MLNNNYNRFLLKIPAAPVLLFILFSFAPLHRYYFSFSEIKVDTKKNILNVSCKLFTDDLENALNKIMHKKFVPGYTTDKQNSELLAKYLQEHFKISIAGKPLKLEFIGYENEGDATWCYLEISKFAQQGKIIIMNDLLFDLLPEQTNIIQFYWNEINKSQKLVNPEKEAMFEF